MPWEQTENEIRHRLKSPDDFIEGSFRTKEIDTGVSLILGKVEGGDSSMVAQAIRFDKDKFDEAKAKAWMKDHKDRFSKESGPNLQQIKGVEIFASGTWNGDEYNEKDLDEMIKAFNATKDKFRPPLKLGHCEEQTLLQRDGLPAAGWISNIYRKGKKLLADFVEIPEKVYDLIRAGAYKKVSSEIYWNATVEDTKFKRLLGAVALLGADLPSVTTLSDIFQMYKADIGELKTYEIDFDMERKKNMDKELELVETQKKLLTLEGELKEKATKLLELETEGTELKKKIFEAEIDKHITEMQSQKIVTPAMLPLIKELLLADKKEYCLKINNEEKKFSKAALLQELLKLYKTSISTVNDKETSMDTKVDNKADNSEKVLSEKIEKYAKEHKVTYAEGYRAVLKQEPQQKDA